MGGCYQGLGLAPFRVFKGILGPFLHTFQGLSLFCLHFQPYLGPSSYLHSLFPFSLLQPLPFSSPPCKKRKNAGADVPAQTLFAQVSVVLATLSSEHLLTGCTRDLRSGHVSYRQVRV